MAAFTTAENEGLAPEAEVFLEDEAEEFADQVKFISVSRSGVRDHPYAFVVVGEVYVPGYMVRQYTLHPGDWMRGTCKVAPPGARLPYRAASVDAVDTMNGPDDDEYDFEGEDLGSSDGTMPTGALRSGDSDDDESDTSADESQAVARNLLDYIEKNNGELRLAGPPHLFGCLAHYYRQEPTSAETIKSWELADSKPGVHSFVRSFPSLFVVVGRHPNQKIFSNRMHAASNAQQRAANAADKKGAAANGTGGGNGLVSKAAQEAARRAAAKSSHPAVQANGLISKAAMEAASRAAAGLQKASTTLVMNASSAADVHDQLSELRSDLSVAMAALASAQQRMERLEAAVRADEATLTSSAA